MAAELDLSLPSHVPEMKKYGDANDDLAQYALYTLLDVPLPELEGLCASIEAEYIKAQGEEEPHLITPAPEYNFAGKRLQDVFEHHLRFSEARLQQKDDCPFWYPLAFVVVNKPDWNSNSVLLVSTDWETGVPDSFQMPVNSETALILTSLRDGDDDWEHLKESFQLRPPTDRGPLWGFHIGVYAADGIVESTLLSSMEPDLTHKDPDSTICKLQAHVPASQPEALIDQCVTAHVDACSKSPLLLQNYLICVASPDYPRTGVLILNLDYQKGRAVPRSQRAAAQDAIFLVRDIVAGRRPWAYSHPVFGVCSTGFANMRALSDMLDPSWAAKRDEALAFQDFANFAADGGGGVVAWRDVVAAFAQFCRRSTARIGASCVHRRLFICCDNDAPEGRGVLLVRVSRDADGDAEMEEGDVEVERCAVGEALQAMADIADGRRAWRGRPMGAAVEGHGLSLLEMVVLLTQRSIARGKQPARLRSATRPPETRQVR